LTVSEVANTYPGFALRGLDLGQITQRYAYVAGLHGEEFVVGVQRWIAELGDAHHGSSSPDPQVSSALSRPDDTGRRRAHRCPSWFGGP
jgi:hypothetical protein